MNENEFEYKGATYVAALATENEFGSLCEGCAFDRCDNAPCCSISCDADERGDERNVIFVEKQS